MQNKPESGWQAYAKYSGIFFQMLVIIGGFTYAGMKADLYYSCYPWCTISLGLTGTFTSLYLVFKQLKE